MKSHHYITSNFDICYADYQKIRGKNCPVGAVVLTEEKCREAASQLGLPFSSAFSQTSNYLPAGCFETGHGSWQKTRVHLKGVLAFNTITDPSLIRKGYPYKTTPAICTKQGTEHLVLLSFELWTYFQKNNVHFM